MGRRFRGPVRPPKIEGPRTNDRISAPNVRVISDTGEQLGILETREAIVLARSRGLDLVEVAGQESPPVCRFMDYGRFKYEDKKRKGKAKKNQKVVDIKEIKIRPKTDSHDIDFKFKSARKFLEEGNKVKVTVRFRGREIMYAEEEAARLIELANRVDDIAEIETPPAREGRTISMMLAPDKRKLQALADRQRNLEKTAKKTNEATEEEATVEATEEEETVEATEEEATVEATEEEETVEAAEEEETVEAAEEEETVEAAEEEAEEETVEAAEEETEETPEESADEKQEEVEASPE
jgi:translation initiation factor IF-3